MTSLRTIFARAIVRRLAYVLVAAVLAWCGMGRAHAQAVSHGDKGAAYAHCMSDKAQTQAYWAATGFPGVFTANTCVEPTASNPDRYFCSATQTTGSGAGPCIHSYAKIPPPGSGWNITTHQVYTFPPGQTCATRGSTTGGFTPPNGSIQCQSGCDVVYGYNGDGTSTATPTGGQCVNDQQQQQCALMQGYYWHPNLNVCAPSEPEDCKPGATPKEGVCQKPEQCPEGMVTDQNGLCKPKDNECPAGKTKGPDGSCVDSGECPAGQAQGKDGTCKTDANNDGTPDEEDSDPDNDPDPDKKEFSGGDDCNNPPSCSGDAIMCGQARIQWRIECNTRRSVNIAGGACDAVPVCTGEKCNAMEYAQLLQQWRTSCAVQKLAAASGTNPGGTPGDANGNGQPDWTENPGDGTNQNLGPEGSPDGVVKEGEEHGADGLDIAGLGFPRSCPQIPTVNVMGHTISMDTTVFCDWMKLGGQFVLIAAALLSLRIMAAGSAA